jgi:hypothetical protein
MLIGVRSLNRGITPRGQRPGGHGTHVQFPRHITAASNCVALRRMQKAGNGQTPLRIVLFRPDVCFTLAPPHRRFDASMLRRFDASMQSIEVMARNKVWIIRSNIARK